MRKYAVNTASTPLRTGLLHPAAWLRYAWGGLKVRGKIRGLPLNDLAAWAAFDDVDAETWSNRYFGREVTRYLIEPPLGGLYFQGLSENSRAVPLFTGALFYSRSLLTNFSGGIAVLPRRLAADLEVRLNSPVNSLFVTETGVELQAGGERMRVDRAVLATTASTARSLYRQADTVEDRLLETPYSASITVAVMTGDSYRVPADVSDVYGFFIPKAERTVVASATNERCKDERRVGKGQLFVAFVSGDAAPNLMERDDEEIVKAALADLDNYYPRLSANVSGARVYRWKEAMPLSRPGRPRLVAQYRATRKSATRVFLAGDYTGMPFTEGAAETGAWAARTLLAQLALAGEAV